MVIMKQYKEVINLSTIITSEKDFGINKPIAQVYFKNFES